MIESTNSQLSIRRQCELLGLNRSSFYSRAGDRDDREPATDEADRRAISQDTRSIGSRRMAALWLTREGEEVNRKPAQRLMRLDGPGGDPSGSSNDGGTTRITRSILTCLRGVKIERRDQVWSSDITYIPMHQGFMYLTAVIDWYSRYVLSWSLSNSLDGRFCLETLEEALRGGKPEIFNTDQGVQYTARSFTGRLEAVWCVGEHGGSRSGVGQRVGGAAVAFI